MKKFTLIIIAIIAVFQLNAQTIYVDLNASGSNDGSSWANAYTDLQSALDNALKGDSIWVAAATYKPSKDKTGNSTPADNRTKTFQLVDSVSLFGGFVGTETNFEDRDWETNETILSGDIGTTDVISDNCYNVARGIDHSTLDGFTITQGNANGPTANETNMGGGLSNNNVSYVKSRNCIFKYNLADAGGGVANYYCGDSIIFYNCQFIADTSGQGGALGNWDTKAYVAKCVFVDNLADEAISGENWGGAIYNWGSGSTSEIVNCTFINNSSSSGGAIHDRGVHCSIKNSIFLDNTPNDFYNVGTVSYTFTNQPGYEELNGNIGGNPLLYKTGEGQYELNWASPCIDAGDPDPVYNDPDGSQNNMGAAHPVFSPQVDALISAIDTPLQSFVYGEYDVWVSMVNLGADPLTSADIEWEVDGTPQITYNWSGNLAGGDTINSFTIGNYSFDQGNHNIKVWASVASDEFHENDTLNKEIYASANMDAGIVSLDSPDTLCSFEPSTDLYVSFKNYDTDSTLTKVDIGWEVDGALQTTYNWSDSLAPGEVSESFLFGSFSFSRGKHDLKIWTENPNNHSDDNTDNDTLNVTIYSRAYDIGLSNIYTPTNPDTIGSQQEVNVAIKNFSQDSVITSARIDWKVDGSPQAHYDWTGSLAPGAVSDSIMIGKYDLPSEGTFNFKLWTESPNGDIDDYRGNDTIFKDIIVANPLCDTFSIGATGDFLTFGKAIDSLINGGGVCGPVVFMVETGTYNEQITIPEIPGTSENNTITFQSASGDSSDVILSNTGGGYTATLDGADYIIFKTMTISADASGSVIEFSNGAANNQIINCEILGEAGSPILIYGSQNNINNIYFHNRLVNGTKGINLSGSITGTEIKENVFENQSEQAIRLDYVKGATISGNTITSNSIITGIYLILCEDNFTIEKNKILLSSGGTAIYFDRGTNTTGNPDRMANNFIYINSSGNDYGIYSRFNTRNMSIIHNSINIAGDATGSININLPDITPIIKNNILINKAGGRVISTNFAEESSDYNCLLTNGTYLVNNQVNLKGHQNSTGQDMHSLSVDPNFISDSDLHTFSPYLNNQGTPIAGITTDIDGELRNGTNPDIGADEYDPLPGLSGTYAIGPSAPLFKTINDAIDSLIDVGVDASVNFEIEDGTYNEQITIPWISNVSETDTIVFRSASADSSKVTITYAATGEDDNYTIKLDGAKYITFKDLTIEATGTEFARDVEIGYNSKYNTFTNNHLLGVPEKSELVYSLNSYDTCNVFTKNLFSNGIRAFNMTYGYSLIVSGNEFLNQTDKAISLTYYWYPEILSNYIHSDTRLTSAIYLDDCRDQLKVNNNQIMLPFGGTGVKLDDCRLATTTDTSEIFNNHVYINTDEQNDYGIYMFLYASNVKVFHNTVHINGNNPASSCYYFGSIDPFNFKLINNNFVNSAGGYVIFYNSSNYYGTYTSNYNNLFNNGVKLTNYYTDLSEWQTNTGQDLNSVSVYPYFVEDTSYHVLHPALNEAGTPLTEVTEDLDGDVRDASNPDIGADEFTPSPTPLSGIYTIAGTSPDYETINDAVQDLTINGVDGAVIFNIASDTLNEQVMIPEITGASPTNTITFQSASGDSSDVLITYTPVNTTHKNTIRLDGADYIIFKNLSISSGEEWGWPVELKSEATHNTFEGNKIFMSAQASKNIDYALVYAKNSLDSNNVFTGNHFQNGSIGIFFENSGNGTQILNNKFINMSHSGIYLKSLNSPKINGNYIDMSTTSTYGINLLYINSANTEKSLVSNNMILINTSDIVTGINLFASGYISVVYNTVKINTSTYSSYTHAFYSTGNNFDILNNIFMLNQGGYAAVVNDTTACTIDYNLYYHPNTTYADMYWDSHTSDLEQYGFDLHSIRREPEFVSDTDLHTRDAWISNKGMPLTEVTTDIDGEARDLTHPDIGADEYEAEILFSGEYTIGAGGDFETFTEAVDSITEVGAIGSVIFNVISGTYDEQFIVPSIPHVTDTITVTFQSVTGDSTDVILQFDATATDNYTVKMDSCSYITFQNMTIKALDTAYARVFEVMGGASNNIIRNNVIESPGTESAVIFSGNDQDNNNQINNNLISGGKIGIQMFGESTSNSESGTEISGNIFESQFAGAISLKYNEASVVTDNLITHPELVDGQWTGIFIDECSSGLIANNSIAFNTETMSAGIVLLGSSNQKIYYNSVNIIGSANDSRAFNQQDGGSNNYLRNNIFSNQSGGMVLYIRDINAITSNYNNYYSTGERFIYYGVSTTEYYWISDLETWQSDYSKDLNSVSVNPQFVSDMDLLPANIVLDGIGTPLAEITEDIEGIERDAEHPDVGAYEFDGCTVSGTFTIGATEADYSTFEDAIESLQTCWVDGPIVFNVQSGTYNEQLIIPEIPRLSETNTITFQSATGDSTDVLLTFKSTSADTNYTVKLDGADFISFKNMTFQATGTDYANVIEISGGASNNQFLSNQFVGVNTTNASNTEGVLVYSPYKNSKVDTSNIFSNNMFLSGSYGIYLNAHYSTYEKNNQITGNKFKDQVSYGIYLLYQDSALISQNEILNISSDNEYYGIYFNGINSLINKNRININTDNAANRGLYFQSDTNSILSNNFIRVNRGTGMELYNGKVFHNSVNISGDNIYGSAVVMKDWSDNACDFKNNIVQNNARGRAMNFGSSALANVISDYNNLYSNGEFLARIDNDIADLAQWTATTSLDANSISVNSKFESDSNLYTKSPVINNAGTPLSEVTDDIDGNIRDAVTPDIGASEFSQTEYLLDADTIHACAYDTVTLDAGGYYDTYSWSNGENTQVTKIDTTGIGLNSIKLISTVTANGQEYKDSVWISFHKPVASTFDVDTCAYSTVDLVASGGVLYEWNSGQDTCSISVYLNDITQNYVVTVYDAYGCYDTDTATLVPYSKPSQPYIYEDNDSLYCDTDGTDYEWYLNNSILQITTQRIEPPESGNYQVIVYNHVCPSDISNIYTYTAPTGIGDFDSILEMALYPIPTTGILYMNFDESFEKLQLDIISSDGKKILTKRLENIEKGDTEELDLGDIPKGLYFIRFSNNNISRTARILVQ